MKKGLRCTCGKIAEFKKNLSFNNYKIDGWVCKHCKEIYYDPEQAERILLLNKLKKSKIKAKLGRIKSNLILRIPKELSKALHLKQGDFVEIGIQEKNNVVLKPLKT